MKFLLFLLISLSAVAENTSTYLDNSILKTKRLDFIAHKGAGEWDNYLVLNIPFSPVADVFKQLIIKEKTQLTSRGEAHLTIITPVEFWNYLKPAGVTIDEINRLARRADIQKMTFKPVCIGRGSAMVDANVEKTFYIVVDSKAALDMRKAIKELYLSRGGDPEGFNPMSYHPHITVGFTKRDLHENDKVVKNVESCISELNFIKEEN